MSKVASDWASRPHCPPGGHDAVNLHKAIAAGTSMPKSKRVVDLQQEGGGTGRTYTPGWFSTARK